MKRFHLLLLLVTLLTQLLHAENGYDLWLRYKPVQQKALAKQYSRASSKMLFAEDSKPADCPKHIAADKTTVTDCRDCTGYTTMQAAADEFVKGIEGITGSTPTACTTPADGTFIAGTLTSLAPYLSRFNSTSPLPALTLASRGKEAFTLTTGKIDGKRVTLLAANTETGVLYGVFHYLRLLQTEKPVDNLSVVEEPRLNYRMLNHWDNLNGTIERGYAGYSLWDWERLPHYKSQRYTDYARANASIGINGTVLNNVNAQAKSLRHDWLVKAAGLADSFRPYGIRVYLTAKFSAPKEIGGLPTANPHDPRVRQWWKDKVKEIYTLIPDFGGFLVKANSEGQPGPQDYGCSHAEGANMLAEALEPFGGVLFWRAFVYQNERHIDRVVTGYNEFKPLDGEFNSNVFVQPKNGAIDFQPREPFHPLFGAMPRTNLAMEVQITQENLGHAGHLVYLGTLFEETLKSITYADGKGLSVAQILMNSGKTPGMSGLAGVPNIGSDINWTGHLFGQANWYVFGCLAWNPEDSAERIADEWIRLTFSNAPEVVAPIKQMMMMSREAYVHYTMPLGLNHIMNFGSHNGPEPWHHDPSWSAYDYHKVTADSIGVDRTDRGSGAARQYHKPVADRFNSLETCPEEYLLWFHRLPFTYRMKSGNTLWEEIALNYQKGVDEVGDMQRLWDEVAGKIDNERFNHVKSLLRFQQREAEWWRDACLSFFGSYSGMPLPEGVPAPPHSLDYYKRIPFPNDWNGYYE